MNYFFTHIFAPYAVTTSSLAGVERALVLESWQTAANIAAANGIHVEFLACPLESDISATPRFARASSFVEHYAIDPHNRKFPTIGGIFDKGVREGHGSYLVYTNMDIGVHNDFYVHSYNLLINAEKARKEQLETDPNVPWTALEYTRVQSIRLKPDKPSPTLTEVLEYPEVGRHPGHDCFILPRHLVPPNMKSGGLVVGMPPWGTMYVIVVVLQIAYIFQPLCVASLILSYSHYACINFFIKNTHFLLFQHTTSKYIHKKVSFGHSEKLQS
jgi:hypothetical protein